MSGSASAVEPRPIVRRAFWTGVFILWVPFGVLGGLALLWAAVASGMWRVPPLPAAPSLAGVRAAWGQPDEVIREQDIISTLFAGYAGCPVTQAHEVWFYDRLILPDSIVFVGSNQQLLCAVDARGSFFFHRSH